MVDALSVIRVRGIIRPTVDANTATCYMFCCHYVNIFRVVAGFTVVFLDVVYLYTILYFSHEKRSICNSKLQGIEVGISLV